MTLFNRFLFIVVRSRCHVFPSLLLEILFTMCAGSLSLGFVLNIPGVAFHAAFGILV